MNDEQLLRLLPWVFGGLLAVLLVVWVIQEGRVKPSVTCICPHCWNVGFPVVKMPGSTLIFILLLLCGALPGIFYGLLRDGFKRSCCPECEGTPMVPIHSPRGAKLLIESQSPGK